MSGDKILIKISIIKSVIAVSFTVKKTEDQKDHMFHSNSGD